MNIIHEILIDCNHHNLTDHSYTLCNILESVLYFDALPSKARDQIDDLWAEVYNEVEDLLTAPEPPTEEELQLRHPFFDV
jgi:TRAP-type C4-dicarboxylate transport system substrate-binding protein